MLVLAKIVLGAYFDTYAANTAPADVLEMFLHVLGAFFGVVVALSVRGRLFAEDCPCRAGLHTRFAFSATVFNHGAGGQGGHIRQDGGKTDFTAVLLRQEKTAFAYEAEPRKYRRRLVRKYPCVGIVLAKALACRNRERRVAVRFQKVGNAEGNLVKESVCRSIVLKIHIGRSVFYRRKHRVRQLDRNRERIVKLWLRRDGGVAEIAFATKAGALFQGKDFDGLLKCRCVHMRTC